MYLTARFMLLLSLALSPLTNLTFPYLAPPAGWKVPDLRLLVGCGAYAGAGIEAGEECR